MLEVWIVVDGLVDAKGELVASTPTTTQMLAALKQAISASTTSSDAIATHCFIPESVKVQVVGAKNFCQASSTTEKNTSIDSDSTSRFIQTLESEDVLLCPLTLDLPATLEFPGSSLYQSWRDVWGLRNLVEQKLGYLTGEGCCWLPVVLTAKGPVYAEVIGLSESRDAIGSVSQYYQPLHLSDAERQQLYQMGWQLVQLLAAPPATYLVQFGFQGQDLYFDRLWPFPGEPAIASLGVQKPDLFTCHWHCLTNQPLFDLTIVSDR